MDAQRPEVAALLRKIAGLRVAIARLPSLSPSPDVAALFTELVAACVLPSGVDVAKLGPEDQRMREELVRLCSDAEARLEAHFSDALAASDRPLDHLGRFPYFGRYVGLSDLEHGLLARYAPGHAFPARVAFVGSGPLPLSSLALAARHMPCAFFDNYDRCGAANERATRLVRAVAAAGSNGVEARMSFRTADVADLQARDLAVYDVVFLAARVGVTAEVVAHLGRHMAAGAALVVRSAHGARGFLFPVVDPEDVARAGFDVLAVCHPDDNAVINSVIVARKPADGPRGNIHEAAAAAAVATSPCGCSTAKATARPTGGGSGGRKRQPRSCHLDAMNETRHRAW
ncbi:hypothetical protein GUJ93_ZPchr0006g42809 [Zizania palustris]|uniref:Nicotianamine synthase n=1 Tax=Zizania palustris TaxID=103762 RepID=A0A8J5W1N5_ZIZPA|nr:hypothetical protein GUJ93_ZPchr0006g42809 [Zizania palustris]